MATMQKNKSKTKARSKTRTRKPAAPARRAASSRSRRLSQTTTDHDEIRQWAEARDAQPAMVKGTGRKNETGILRLDFPGYTGDDKLEKISWDEFFDKFEDSKLALVYQEKTAGGQRSNFNKLVKRD